MAKEIKIVVEQNSKGSKKEPVERKISKEKEQFDLLQKNYKKARKAGTTSQVENSTQEAKRLTKEIKELLKVTEPTAKQLEALRKNMDKFAALNQKLDKAAEEAAKNLKEIIKQEEALNNTRSKKTKKAFNDQHISNNKRKKEGDFKDPSIEKEIRSRKITYTEGPNKGKIVKPKQFMEMGASGSFSHVSNPQIAAELYELIISKHKNASATSNTQIEVQSTNKPEQVESEQVAVETEGEVSVVAKEVTIEKEQTTTSEPEIIEPENPEKKKSVEVERNPLQEKYQKQFDLLQADYSKAKEAGATNKVANSEVEVKALVKQIQELLAITNPTAEGLSMLRRKINAFADINEKLGKVMGPVSKGLEETIKKEEELRKARVESIKKVEEAQSVLARKKTGEMGLKNSIIEEEIRKSGITYKSGAHAGKNVSREKFMEMGAAGNFDKVSSPEVAANLYKLLLEKQDAARKSLQEEESELQKIDADLAELESKKVTVNSGEEIILNAKGVKFENEKSTATPPKTPKPHEGPEEGGSLQPIGSTQAIEKQTSALGRAFKQFTLYNIALKAVKSALREAVQTVKELDQYLTEQAMVTGKTREETYALVGAYQDLAAQCGATTKEIAQVATEYMKQGKTTQEALVLTEAAVKAAKVARVSVGDSVNYLTTALNGFQLEAEEAMVVSDKFAALAAASATDYDELAIALSKVASQANLAGMSMDYTTALLTKGLETTREAPETMGTALKTIIARMRELGDFGETLEGDTDINNVEKQLKYVDIALRDTSGELRSTEDVLDELGKKWDTLSKNQQAAVAKALAGTRQQARLIAMMEDYERVTELQQLSQRSAGATAAQAGVYLEGMEAALNKIQVAWENIVMKLTDSELIIGVFKLIGTTLEGVADMLGTTAGQITVFSTLGTIALVMLGHKLRENELAKQSHQLSLQQQEIEQRKLVTKLEQEKVEAKSKKLQADSALSAAKEAVTKKETYVSELKSLKVQLQKKQANGTITADEKKQLQTIDAKIKKGENELVTLQEKYKVAEQEAGAANIAYETASKKLTVENGILTNLQAQMGMFGGIIGLVSSLQGLLLLFKPIYATILFFQKLVVKEKNKEFVATLRQQAAESKGLKKKLMNAGASMAESAGKVPYVGWAIGIAILAALCGIVINAAIQNKKYEESAEGTADSINKMSNKIYELTQKSNALNEIVNKFEDIDNQVIKTTADIEEMNSLLSSAGDHLSTEREKDNKGEEIEGTSEQDIYNAMEDQDKKLQYIQGKAEDAEKEADKERQKALDEINDLKNRDYAEYQKMIDDETSNGKYLAVQSSIKQTAREHAYDQIDKLKEDFKNEGGDIDSLQDVESLVSSLVSKMSSEDALEYANNANKMRALVNSLASKEAALATDTFLDEGKGIKERINAYNQLKETLKDNDVALNALKASYNDFEELSKNWSPGVINLIDREKLSIKAINDLYDSYKILQKEGAKIAQEEYKESMDKALSQLEPSMANLEEVLKNNFASMLSDGEDFNDQWDILLNQFANTFTKTALDIGQSLTKFNNTTNDFYEKSLKWGEMNQSERMEFINDNADLFTDDPQTEVDEGAELLKAFQTGNYQQLEKSLKTQMEKRREEELESINELLAVEKLKKNNKNTALIAELEAQKAYLEDTDNLYKASLEILLEQQQKQLDEYRDMLEKEKEALTESLEKRKEAYEKYFDEISKEEEDAEYEEERDKLVTNIAKLASSGDADSKKQTMELEQQLKELEAERLQALKERAREAILENMDNEVAEINDKFDKLLENNQALLAAMNGDLQDPNEFLSKLISNKLDDGLTQLEFEDYFKTLESIYGNTLSDVNWDEIKEEIINQLFLNVNGQDITLNEMDEKAVYDAVKKALRGIGKR